MHAMLAVRALARLSGLLDDDLATPYNESAASSLHALLTPKLSNMLRDESTRELLRNLNSNLESPQVLTQLVCNVLFSSTLAKEHCDSLMSVSLSCVRTCLQIIWNSATRAELLKFVDLQRISQLPDGSYDMRPAQDFKYKGLSKELHVGNVYLRVYNEQPDFEIVDGQDFCEALVDFISGIVEERKKLLALELKGESGINPPPETKFEHSEIRPPPVPPSPEKNHGEEEEGESQRQGEEGDRAVVVITPDTDSSFQQMESQSLVRNLTMALTSLQVQLCCYLFQSLLFC